MAVVVAVALEVVFFPFVSAGLHGRKASRKSKRKGAMDQMSAVADAIEAASSEGRVRGPGPFLIRLLFRAPCCPLWTHSRSIFNGNEPFHCAARRSFAAMDDRPLSTGLT